MFFEDLGEALRTITQSGGERRWGDAPRPHPENLAARPRYVLAVSFGGLHRPSALCLARQDHDAPGVVSVERVRRFPGTTTHELVAQRTAEDLRDDQLTGRASVIADVSFSGREGAHALFRAGVSSTEIVLGDFREATTKAGNWSLPYRSAIVAAHGLLHNGRLRFPPPPFPADKFIKAVGDLPLEPAKDGADHGTEALAIALACYWIGDGGFGINVL